MRRLRVALCYNLKREQVPEGLPPDADAEWDSEETVAAIAAALSTRHEVTRVEGDRDCYERLRALQPDLVFNIAEGWETASREGFVPTVCEMLGLRYHASDPVALNLCLHKAHTKEVLRANGVRTPDWRLLHPVLRPVLHSGEGAEALAAGLCGAAALLPAVVKPLFEGSSKGIRDSSFVRTADELRAEVARIHADYGQAALVEAFLPGREYTVGLLGNPPRVLPLVEIDLSALPAGARPIYSFEAKWVWDTPERPVEVIRCPAAVAPALEAEIGALCVAAWQALGLRDWARIDVRLDGEGRPAVIEVNPLPGLLPDPAAHSCLPMAARAAGLDFEALIHAGLDAAIDRHGLR